ncbi:hypothetical protein MKX64_21075 [Paenibacillus sp. FSL M8-0334]|uniref:hypothetical protein n=1 Tax=Paenibacillus sp. FSL M8-0334 TaxID=2921623 RepID=UPI0030F65E47
MNVKKRQMLIVLLTALLLAGFQAPAHGEATGVRATWVWQTEFIADRGEQLIAFAKDEGINLIYLQIQRQLPKPMYEHFIQQAHENGIAVHALGGDPRWALAEYRNDMLDFADWVTSYNREAAARFDGIHLDIEPYVLDQWEDQHPSIIESWQRNLTAFLNTISDAGLETGIDIPFWFDSFTLADGTGLNESLMNDFDHVTVMAYRNQLDSANGIISLVQSELELASRLGHRVIVAVNTKEMPKEPHTSFYGLGKTYMNQTLLELQHELSSFPSFAGLAIHDYRSWESMPHSEDSGPNQPPDNEAPAPVPDPVPEPAPDPGTGEPVPAPDPIEHAEPIRGTYIWEAEQAVHESQEILEFAREKNLNLLYVRLDLEQPFSAYSSFVRDAAEAGIEVHALGGHPLWALEENRDRMMRLVHYVKDYNRNVDSLSRFHGIHLDIEPYVLPGWSSHTPDIISQWTSNIDAFVREMRRDSELKSSMDMAAWLDKHAVPGENLSLAKWMISRMDHVSVMAFRDTAEGSNGIVSIAREEIAYADELGKPILLSVEMKESHEGNHITFYEEGAAYMEEELAKLPGLLQHSSSYSGIVVHAYDYWKNARP